MKIDLQIFSYRIHSSLSVSNAYNAYHLYHYNISSVFKWTIKQILCLLQQKQVDPIELTINLFSHIEMQT